VFGGGELVGAEFAEELAGFEVLGVQVEHCELADGAAAREAVVQEGVADYEGF
jgi:hypothetical protein